MKQIPHRKDRAPPDINCARVPAAGPKVGSYAPNKLGLYDMHGNVWQWCEDLYDPTNPKALARVLRGESWNSDGEGCRSAYRGGCEPGVRYLVNGFRLAAVPEVGAK